MKREEKKIFDINDLPRFSPWPARLFGIDPWETKQKTPQEIDREYGCEKWGKLLEEIQESEKEVLIDEVDQKFYKNPQNSLCSFGNQFELLPTLEAHQRYKRLVQNTIENYLPASAIVELGAGYGSLILDYVKQDRFAGLRFIAGEYTNSGIELIKKLSYAQHSEVEVVHCDFNASPAVNGEIPKDSIVFTSWAIACVSTLQSDFFKYLCDSCIKVAIHVEPCYEHYTPDTLIGLMRRQYIKINGYNSGFITSLYKQQSQGVIEILEEKPAVMGINALAPVSIIVWRPCS
ncbi:MAG: hypothetical protein OEV42_13805 [Deltaproteobacteria bacterium]|nr:hypothetical protein [Deltaproteobacteria bacterium]